MTDTHTGITTSSPTIDHDCEPNRPVCGIRDVLDRIGDTWSVLVTIQLRLHGPRRFGQLLRSVDGISQRMLTVTLRRLQRDGLIDRTVLDTSPPQVEYSLTEVGHSLTDILKQLVDWAATNRADIEAARRTWDQATAEC
ncbi:MAG: helix-turn-helix domain-containing protein [Gordonia sp. (in: high G+C Gram-positive bacteria)]